WSLVYLSSTVCTNPSGRALTSGRRSGARSAPVFAVGVGVEARFVGVASAGTGACVGLAVSVALGAAAAFSGMVVGVSTTGVAVAVAAGVEASAAVWAVCVASAASR